ncbi:phage gene 29 protein family protein [Rhodococcus aetherivorans]|uniref:phage gene 29 protein family protein n=1 Tax=Rhodococcus aetherivorans TaxID=191292 RepID=UPI0002D23516|nr:DUF2744 domain-containing protein [Rhodococcus aetherivorans]CCW14597.1 hypothetical protein EBESD8_51670 [Rhodococcus aetherivorans]
MGKRIPTRENCDPNDPEDKFQWVFVAWPFMGDQTYTPHDDILKMWSKRMCDLGFELPDPDKSQLKLVGPVRGPQHTLNGAVGWVDKNDPDPEPVVIPDMGAYTRFEQEIVAEQLRYHGVIPGEEQKVSKAKVRTGDQFEPSEHSPSTVNGYLLGVQAQGNSAEMRRVVAAEMAGKKRDQILRKWRGI